MSGYRSLIAAFILLTGCATTPVVDPPPLIPINRRPEEVSKLPVDPDQLQLPTNLPQEDWVEPVEAGQQVRRAGILVSEARAWRDAQFRMAYRGLRDIDRADREVWATHRSYYEDRHTQATKALEKLQPTWWDTYGIFLVAGITFLAGAGTTIGIAAAIKPVR